MPGRVILIVFSKRTCSSVSRDPRATHQIVEGRPAGHADHVEQGQMECAGGEYIRHGVGKVAAIQGLECHGYDGNRTSER